MLEFFEKIDHYTEQEWEEVLPKVSTWILQIVQNGTPSEIRSIANHILNIVDPKKFIRVVEHLFITDSQLYVKLVREGNPEIAKRRKLLSG
mgnify:CR=1 FL=1